MSTSKVKVALFGGSFDPPHFGHALVINNLLTCSACDEVWLVPSGMRADKVYHVSNAQRLAMMNLFLAEVGERTSSIKISTVEIDSPGGSIGTIDTVRHFRREYPQHEFSFVIGGDLVKDLPRWKDADSLRAEVPFLVISRMGESSVPTHAGFQITELHTPFVACSNISSSLVRSCIASGHPTFGLLPTSVRAFCEREKLYRMNNLITR